MPDQFKREDRYIVIKRKHLSETQLRLLNDFLADACIEQVPLAVVVEGDWPEYEPVWQMIERRVKNERAAIAPLDSVVERCISILRGNLQAGLHPDARKQRDADISILEAMKGGSTWSATAASIFNGAEGAGDNASAPSQDQLLFDALAEFVYEATHLSPEREDGSHWCKISSECLSNARYVLAHYTPAQAIEARRAETGTGSVHESAVA